MRRTLAMLALVALAACREPRHLWPLEMGDIALETAVFAILEARAAPHPVAQPQADERDTEAPAHERTAEERRAEERTAEERTPPEDEPDAGATAERATEEPSPPAEREASPAYQEETAEELPRSDDELTADMEEPPPEDANEEAVEEQEVAAVQLEQARRLQAMQAELLAIEEQLRQQYDVNVAVAAELIVHTHRLIYTQLLAAALLDKELRR